VAPEAAMTDAQLIRLQELLGHTFVRRELLLEALTHRSYANEHPASQDNERLEFLGDAVLGLVVSDLLLAACQEAKEGDLSRRRAQLVNTAALATIARRLDLGSVLRLGRGEQTTGGPEKRSLLADTLEALVGAAFLDGGLEAAATLVRRVYADEIERVAAEPTPRDFKSELQEQAQRQGHAPPGYQVTAEVGPDHQKRFVVAATLVQRPELLAEGEGSSKKQAEQAAAQVMLDLLARGALPEEE